MRIMKNQKLLQRADLVRQAAAAVSQYFSAKLSSVDEMVDVLIEKEYFDVEPNSSSEVLLYIP